MHLNTQITLEFCGPATVCAVLNSLSSQGLLPPVSSTYTTNTTVHGHHYQETFRYFVQAELFNQSCVTTRVPFKQYEGSLVQLAKILSCFTNATFTKASDSDVSTFRQTVVQALTRHQYVTVNFDRGGLYEVPKGGGHHSPIGAYDAKTDRVLLMDVARYKYPFVWVPTTMMFDAMVNLTSSGESRGYIVVS